MEKDLIEYNTEENGMIIDESDNTFEPKDKKELAYLRKLVEDSITEYKAGQCIPFEEFEW